ncbi:GNAT family N-acetyltransferase [Alteribacillus sp. HJP-4]|uniref:GNAT family N-acetyltransferase n=1 Tax=Alteribacillus sp. HJP-4 TaxID=2775394 RepID=UPI0035CD2BCB
MKLYSTKMKPGFAHAVLHWKYEAPYDFYNQRFTALAMQELLRDLYRAVVNENKELIGFYCTGHPARVPAGYRTTVYEENATDVGLGMNPEYTGLGYGRIFLSHIINEVKREEPRYPLRLSVAAFNKRAVHLYKKAGFSEAASFHNENLKFITMIKRD